MSEQKLAESVTIIAIIHEDGQPLLCEYHPNAIMWEVADGPYRGVRGCDACLHDEFAVLKRDRTQFVCVEEDRRIDMGEEIEGLPLFGLGRVVTTPGAFFVLGMRGRSPEEFIQRHVTGDWGDLDEHDAQMNERALQEGWRIFSRYELGGGTQIYVITEWNRSATTILLADEY